MAPARADARAAQARARRGKITRMRSWARFAALAAIAAFAGCYQPTFEPCAVTCAGAGSACPAATSCGTDGFCHAPGEALCTDIDARPPDATPADAGDGGLDPLLTGCVVRLMMDEPSWSGLSGEVGDACGDDDRGTAIAGATTVADGVRGRAGQFGGGSTCVRIADRAALHAGAALTFSAWVFPIALDGVTSFGLVSKRNDVAVDAEYSVFLWTDDHVYVDIDNENDRFDGATALVNGAWQQVTVVYDGAASSVARVRIYVDGVLDVVGPESSASATATDADLFIGCLPVSSPTQGFEGKLDEVVIWSRALSAIEVAAWHAQTAPAAAARRP